MLAVFYVHAVVWFFSPLFGLVLFCLVECARLRMGVHGVCILPSFIFLYVVGAPLMQHVGAMMRHDNGLRVRGALDRLACVLAVCVRDVMGTSRRIWLIEYGIWSFCVRAWKGITNLGDVIIGCERARDTMMMTPSCRRVASDCFTVRLACAGRHFWTDDGILNRCLTYISKGASTTQ